MKQYFSVFFFILTSLFAFSQYQIGLVPRVSPDRGIYQKVGNTTVEIKYGSPAVKDRQIWDGLVPYEEVWRAGANNATTIEFSNDVLINDKKLISGTYALFVIPRQSDNWTIIFNKVADQWGAFKYDSSQDVLKTEVPIKKNPIFQENLEYSIEQDGYQHGSIQLTWEHIALEIDFDTDYTNQFIKEVEIRVAKADSNIKWVVYLQGAEHLEQIDTEIATAKTWIEKSELFSEKIAEWNDQYYPQDYIKGHLYWVKAKLYAKSGDHKTAVKYAERMMLLGDKSLYYNKKNEREQIDKKIAEWKAN